MTASMTNPSDLDLHLEPAFDGPGERVEPGPSSVANPGRTRWTGYAKSDRDRLPSR